jgi:hypothetical protein
MQLTTRNQFHWPESAKKESVTFKKNKATFTLDLDLDLYPNNYYKSELFEAEK